MKNFKIYLLMLIYCCVFIFSQIKSGDFSTYCQTQRSQEAIDSIIKKIPFYKSSQLADENYINRLWATITKIYSKKCGLAKNEYGVDLINDGVKIKPSDLIILSKGAEPIEGIVAYGTDESKYDETEYPAVRKPKESEQQAKTKPKITIG